MEIKKADSKGRVTGFTPGTLYAFDRNRGYFSEVVIKAPDGRPVEEALNERMADFVHSLGTAEEAEYLLNLAMRNKNWGNYEVVD